MKKKRVELGVHTNMSVMDSVNTASDYIDRALLDWQPAIAITDKESAAAFPKAYNTVNNNNINKYKGIKLIYGCELTCENGCPFYVLAKNKKGLKKLYKLISKIYDKETDEDETVSLSEIDREDLILGTSIMGEPMKKIIGGADDDELESVLKKFDYVLLNPAEYFPWYTKGEVSDSEVAKKITKRIISLCEENNVLPVASDEAHFVFSDDGECRKMLLEFKGEKDCENQPNLYFRTTDEMLYEFEYLGKKKAREVVIKNSNLIADMADDTFPPYDEAVYPNESEKLIKMTYDAAYKKYGDPLPEAVKERIESEISILSGNSKNVMEFILAREISNNALSKGFRLGNRGDIGSSFVAYLLGITDINPLDAHYFCEKCRYIEFHNEEKCGADLPDKICPGCKEELGKDGFTLPQEVCMGCDSERNITIDFNVPKELLGESREVLKNSAKGKTADFGEEHVLSGEEAYDILGEYMRKRKLKFSSFIEAEYAEKLIGCKRDGKIISYGGGIFVLPPDKEAEDYTTVQHFSNIPGRKGMHFSYQEFWKLLLRIYLFDHGTLQAIHNLEDITGKKSSDIRLDDKATMELINNCDTDGIDEFEKEAAKEMIKTVKPGKFEDLIKISGFLHGTGVWVYNGEELFKKGFDFSELVSLRDDVMLELMKYGIDRKTAYMISERVKYGKGVHGNMSKLKKAGVPKWFIDSCNAAAYMFPKAHSAGYVKNSFILAYYKAHYREEFNKVMEGYKTEE